ncbi:MAG: hypothetical protein ACTTKH_04455 [Treponema sp.]
MDKAYTKKEVVLLRENTNFIINANKTIVSIIREGDVKEDIKVRISLSALAYKKNTLHSNISIMTTPYVLTCYFNEDIKKGDVLKTETGTLYKVIEIENVTFGGTEIEYCYKKTGKLEKMSVH